MGVFSGGSCLTLVTLVPVCLGLVLFPLSTCSIPILLHPELSYVGSSPSLANMPCHLHFLGKQVFALPLLW